METIKNNIPIRNYGNMYEGLIDSYCLFIL